MEDLGDGRYRAAVPAGWAPNATSGPLAVRFLDGAAEFRPDDSLTSIVGYDVLRTVKYGAAVCPAGSHTVPDPSTGATCVCAKGYARDADTTNASAAVGCHKVRAAAAGGERASRAS